MNVSLFGKKSQNSTSIFLFLWCAELKVFLSHVQKMGEEKERGESASKGQSCDLHTFFSSFVGRNFHKERERGRELIWKSCQTRKKKNSEWREKRMLKTFLLFSLSLSDSITITTFFCFGPTLLEGWLAWFGIIWHCEKEHHDEEEDTLPNPHPPRSTEEEESPQSLMPLGCRRPLTHNDIY